ncbi:MAG: hypothetical protein ABSC61_03015 [Anaerolineales bacterium]
MNKKQTLIQFVSLILLVLSVSCTASPAAPTATPTLTPVPLPTFTPTPTFPLPEGIVTFDIPPDKKFPGHSYGQGETSIILANMSSGGEGQWDPFVKAVDKQKFTVITFSYLQSDYIGASQEIAIVLAQLRNVGYQHVVCIGASLGVTACGSVASEPEMIGLVMIAGPNFGGSLLDIKYPKLFIAAENDSWAKDTQLNYDNAAEPRELVIYPGIGMHGTDIFNSSYGDKFLQTLLDFVGKLA